MCGSTQWHSCRHDTGRWCGHVGIVSLDPRACFAKAGIEFGDKNMLNYLNLEQFLFD